MSAVQQIEEILAGSSTDDQVRQEKRRLLDVANRLLPKQGMSAPAALFMVQRARCFHCGGYMPLFNHKGRTHDAPSREHVLPAGVGPLWTFGVSRWRASVVIAHKLCNVRRGTRPFTLLEWEKAHAVWTEADRTWLEAGQTASPFLLWIELANRMQTETRP